MNPTFMESTKSDGKFGCAKDLIKSEELVLAVSTNDNKETDSARDRPNTETPGPTCAELCNNVEDPGCEPNKAKTKKPKWLKDLARSEEPVVAGSNDNMVRLKQAVPRMEGANSTCPDDLKDEESPTSLEPGAGRAGSGQARQRAGSENPKLVASTTESAKTRPGRDKPTAKTAEPK